jgi:hypothetical protein
LQAVANKTTTEWFELERVQELERAQGRAQELERVQERELEPALKLVRYTVPE